MRLDVNAPAEFGPITPAVSILRSGSSMRSRISLIGSSAHAWVTKSRCEHGFRAMAATRLSEMGRWSIDAIERQLAYEEQKKAIERAYTRAEY